MSDDTYEPGEERTLMAYPCGCRVGDRVRLRAPLAIRDHRDRPTGEVLGEGPLWTVLPGIPSEPAVVWLRQPNGKLHTWGGSVFGESFELVAPAPPVGSKVALKHLPEWVDQLPPDSQRLFELCVGRALTVDDIAPNGLIVVDASPFDPEMGGGFNSIMVEAELVEPRP